MTNGLEVGKSGEVVLYKAPDGQVRLDVRLEQDTVWLTQAQMAELFGRERSVVTKHVNNVFAEGELVKKSNVQNLHIASSDKPVAAYSLDVIISVGYRVRSKRGVQFRQWATRVLREHLVQGYTFNQTRLAERGLLEARQTLDLLARTLQNQALVDDTGRAVLELVTSYADTWRLLLEYDEDRLASPPGARPSKGVLDYAKASTVIADFKRELMTRKEATALFGNPRGEALEGILASIEQTCSARHCTARAKRKRRTCCTSSSRITRFRMATNALDRFCSCFICGKRTLRIH